MRRIAALVLVLLVVRAAPAPVQSAEPRREPTAGSVSGTPPSVDTVAQAAARNRVAVNMAGILLAGFLVFFMQAGFALLETGLTRAKNVAHTMSMNLMVYAVGALGFWVCGFALMFGDQTALADLGGAQLPAREFSLPLFGREFRLFGYEGFFLSGGRSLDMALLALFLFQMMFMDTAATIPTGAMAERWKFTSFLAFSLCMSAVIYPVYGNWVWGNGWLSRLGADFGLGHGHVDFAGSSVVHMTGGFTALVGAYLLGPRIGKYKPDGTPNPLPAHNVPMYMLGTFMLAFGWFGFNTGNALAASDPHSARIAVNTVLSSAAGALASLYYMWTVYKKPDPSFLCNGMLAGLVAVTAPCAFITPAAAVLIGAVAGVLVIWSCLFLERRLKVDDPVGAVSIHATAGTWGVLALGLFADGTYAPTAGFNGVPGNVTGLLYGSPSQFAAQCVGVLANLVWVVPASAGFFWVVGKLIGNRVSPQVEVQGLDVPELGAVGYITLDPKLSEGRVVIQVPAEPRPASVPPNGAKRFTVLVEGVDLDLLMQVWSGLCQRGERPPPAEFRAVYPFMTTVQGNRFRFRGGDPQSITANLERLLRQRTQGQAVRVRVEE
jgi:Amt family ammonium transporter